MRVIFMGTPGFSVPALEAVAARHDVVCVYTQPPRAAGRGQKPRPSPVQAAAEDGLLEVADAATLTDAWRMVSRVRNAVLLARGKPSDQFPRAALERTAVAGIMGYPLDQTDALLNDYLRTTRHAKAVVDRVFWE